MAIGDSSRSLSTPVIPRVPSLPASPQRNSSSSAHADAESRFDAAFFGGDRLYRDDRPRRPARPARPATMSDPPLQLKVEMLFAASSSNRKRNRISNALFFGHPLAQGYVYLKLIFSHTQTISPLPKDPNFVHPADILPGYSVPRRPTAFTSSRKTILSIPDTLVPPSLDQSDRSVGRLSRMDRYWLRQTRRSRWSHESILRAETDLRALLVAWGAAPESAYKLEHSDAVGASIVEENDDKSEKKGNQTAPLTDKREKKDDENMSASVSDLEMVHADEAKSASTTTTTASTSEDWVIVSSAQPTATRSTLAPSTTVDDGCLAVTARDDKCKRLLIHMLCRYYGVASHSVERDGGDTAVLVSNPFNTDNARKKSDEFKWPKRRFVDFLYQA
ncbi:hypothetical protein BJ742DRAFT_744642 [Cladochytrium replicatum]|nr:hypothetical protein BJ742DRAFT_744642 [Cladochytrium replicatum]